LERGEARPPRFVVPALRIFFVLILAGVLWMAARVTIVSWMGGVTVSWWVLVAGGIILAQYISHVVRQIEGGRKAVGSKPNQRRHPTVAPLE
jgi:membrane protein YdbS with pleckstrin-like domain